MSYIFYADIYFIQNTIIKIFVLYLTLSGNKLLTPNVRKQILFKMVSGACVVTLVEILFLMSNLGYRFLQIIFLVAELPCLFNFILDRKQTNKMRLYIMGYLNLVLINSVVEVFWNWFGENASFILLLIFACCVVWVWVHMYQNYRQMQKGIFEVCISYEGKDIWVKGLYDSGNGLKDPYTGNGVHIVNESLLGKLGIHKEEPVLVPYHALGNDMGVLEVYYIEKIMVEGEKGRITIQNCPVGVTKDNLFREKKYEMILNEEVF